MFSLILVSEYIMMKYKNMKSPLTTSLRKQTTISKRRPESFARTSEAYHI